jgi:N12 class adenine-specific DNA methylase
MRNRKKFCAKIATGDYDAVIIGHTQLEKIPMSFERQRRLIDEQIDEIEDGIRDLKETGGARYSIKQLEKTRKSLEARLTRLIESKTRDNVVTFEDLGVDRLFVDEAHNFKDVCYRGYPK